MLKLLEAVCGNCKKKQMRAKKINWLECGYRLTYITNDHYYYYYRLESATHTRNCKGKCIATSVYASKPRIFRQERRLNSSNRENHGKCGSSLHPLKKYTGILHTYSKRVSIRDIVRINIYVYMYIMIVSKYKVVTRYKAHLWNAYERILRLSLTRRIVSSL